MHKTHAAPVGIFTDVKNAVCLLLLMFCLASPADAAKRPMQVDDQFRLAEPGTPLISPDGQWVLYSVTTPSLPENRRETVAWLAATNGTSAPRRFLRAGDASAAWAPDSRYLFFLRNVDGVRQLFAQRRDAVEAEQVSAFDAAVDGSWQLSDDGTSFLIVRSETSPSGPGADSDVVFVDEGSNGQTRNFWSNLWRFDVATKALKRVTQRDWSIEEFDGSPDGRRAVVAARPDNQRNTRGLTELFIVDVATGAVRQLTKNAAPENGPIWSPDGRSILFTAVTLESWQHGNGDLWLVDVATGATRNLTPNHTGRFVQPHFSPDGKTLYVSSGYGTTRFPARIDVSSGRVTPLLETAGAVRVGSWSRDRTAFAYVYQDFTTPPDVYVGRTGVTADRQQRLTSLNPWVLDEIALGTVERVEWPSFDGRRIEGLLHLPPGGAAAPSRRPMIVHVACGPGCAWLNVFSIRNHVFAGLGYAQLSPNVRGASNYDHAHIQANRFDIGGGDRRDLMAGVDAMIARGVADPERLGISGWSYGGVLAGYTITQTTRFKAASLGAMVSDWTSEFGAGAHYDMELWYLGGNPWTNAEHWRERSSLTHVHRVRTPTLLHHGDLDEADSPFQSMNFFAGLQKFGTLARLLRYPDEPHDLQQPRHLRIRDLQDVAWFEWYVSGRGTPPLGEPRRAPAAMAGDAAVSGTR